MSKTHGACDNCGEDVAGPLLHALWWMRRKLRRKKILVAKVYPGQTMDFIQWQDGSGNVIARIDKDNNFIT